MRLPRDTMDDTAKLGGSFEGAPVFQTVIYCQRLKPALACGGKNGGGEGETHPSVPRNR